MTDRQAVHTLSLTVTAALLLVLLLPLGEHGRWLGAAVMLPAAVAAALLLKKRSSLSVYKRHILLIMTAFALVLVSLYYLSGLRFGFYRNPYRLTWSNALTYLFPTVIVTVSTELFRCVMVAQKGKLAPIACYVCCVMADMLLVSTVASVHSFARFMELVAAAAFPAMISNLLYTYLCRRYGAYPNLSYRLITALHTYLLPISSGIEDSLLIFCKLIFPILIFLFVDALYEKRKKYAVRGRLSRTVRIASATLTASLAVGMLGLVMLVSNQFRYGALVIATESMTGEINKGDVAVFEAYGNQPIEEGLVIVFDKNDVTVVHRVVDIKIINGVTQYYTKGDANEENDAGFITEADVVGVVHYKLPLAGYPTLWLRSLFKK